MSSQGLWSWQCHLARADFEVEDALVVLGETQVLPALEERAGR